MPFPQGPRAVSWCPPEPLSSAAKLFGSQSAPACSGEEIFSFPSAGPWIKELNSAGPRLGPAVHPEVCLPAGLCAPHPNPWRPTIFTDFSPLYYPLPQLVFCQCISKDCYRQEHQRPKLNEMNICQTSLTHQSQAQDQRM